LAEKLCFAEKFLLGLPCAKEDPVAETEYFLCVQYLFEITRNFQQWYQSRLRLFKGVKEAEGRSLLQQ